MSTIQYIKIADFNYSLPDERIAKYPFVQRDASKLLIYRRGEIREERFDCLPDCLPKQSLLVFNNTRVIQARLLFRKATGAQIEIFCLEPAEPVDYALNFQQTRQCSWRCLIGNLRKWKEGLLQQTIQINGDSIVLTAEKTAVTDNTHLVIFTWTHPTCTFADLLDAAGQLPVPPYLHRATEQSDLQTYQTVYSKVKGSVAAPTAGLHFTREVLTALRDKGINMEEITLHVGAGTFQPVKTENIGEHSMHTEYFTVNRDTLQRLLDHPGPIIAVGTTSVRTLESLYYIGATLINKPDSSPEDLIVKQWDPYKSDHSTTTSAESLRQILQYMDKKGLTQLVSATQIMIVPGYTFRMTQGLITNFHQPQSTLLLLVSAFVKGKWREIYNYALEHNFRFLSYGDSSLILQE